MKVVTKDTLKYFWGKVKTYIGTAVSTKQDTLVSGTSIKTVNSTSLLGSGDVDVDNVVHGKLESNNFYAVQSYALDGTPSFESTAVTGDVNKIYIDVNANKVYRYYSTTTIGGGGQLVPIGAGGGTTHYYKELSVTDEIIHGKLVDGSFYVGRWLLNTYGIPSGTDPVTPNENYIYIDVTTNLVYRYRNSYIQIGGGDLSNYYTKSEVNSAIVDSNPVIVEGTRSGSMLTAVAPFAELMDKQKITLWLNTNLPNYVTLNLTLSDGTTTGAKQVWGQSAGGNLSQVSGSYWSNCPLEIMYDATHDRWITVGQRDTNNILSTMNDNVLAAGTSTTSQSVTAKLLRDNFYLKSEINTTIGDIETLLANI